MSTNYYFKVNPKIIIDSNVSAKLVDYLLEKTPFELHIGMTSIGWPPLFEKTKFYSSVKEIKDFYLNNKDAITIIDEYEDELSFSDLENKLIKWNITNSTLNIRDYEGLYYDDEGYQFSTHKFS